MRPSWISINRYVEGAEPEFFKIQFSDWQQKATAPKIVQRSFKIDMDAILLPFEVPVPDVANCEDCMEVANSMLVAFNSFVYVRGKFVALPEFERGHFFELDAYVFLCIYRATPDRLEALINHDESDFSVPVLAPFGGSGVSSPTGSPDDALECVVYFIQSNKTSKVPYSNFKLSTLKEMEELVKRVYKCDLRVKVVEYGVEPFALLAHLENSYVLHSGSRNEYCRSNELDFDDCMYQIKTDYRYQTTRTIQVDVKSGGTFTKLSRDCFFFYNRQLGSEEEVTSVLWKGDDYEREYIECAAESVQKIIKLNQYRRKSNTESSESVENETCSQDELREEVMNGQVYLRLPANVEYVEKDAEYDFFGRFVGSTISIPFEPAKLFLCSSTSGFFKLDRFLHYNQNILSSECCLMLDPGSDYPLYVWIGKDSSSTLKTLVRKFAMVWLDKCQDGRRYNTSDVVIKSVLEQEMGNIEDYNIKIIEQSREPIEFTSFFLPKWDSNLFLVQEPGNLFSRGQGQPQ